MGHKDYSAGDVSSSSFFTRSTLRPARNALLPGGAEREQQEK